MVVTEYSAISKVAVDFFSNLFTSEVPTTSLDLLMGDLSFWKLTEEESLALDKPFIDNDVVEALKSLHPMKALGPGGIHAMFFKKHWPTVGPAITKILLGILNNGDSLHDLNDTFITLIPQSEGPF